MRTLFPVLILIASLAQSATSPDSSKQQTPTQKKHAVSNQVPPPPPTVINNQSFPNKQEESSKANTEHSPERSPWGDVPAWLLVFVGAVAAWIAIRTLDDIKKQTVNATKAAESAEKSANALIASERAWVMTFVDPVTVIFKSGVRADESSLSFELIYQNEGRSPCWITEKSVWFAIVDAIPIQPILDVPTKRFTVTEPLIAKDKNTLSLDNLRCKGIHQFTLSAVPTADGPKVNYPIFYGLIKYRDAFGSNYETRFGYRVVPGFPRQSMEPMERIPSSAFNNNT